MDEMREKMASYVSATGNGSAVNPGILEQQEVKFGNDTFEKYRNLFSSGEGTNLKLTPLEKET